MCGKKTAHAVNPPQSITWAGEVRAQNWWMDFYTKVLTELGVSTGVALTVNVECKTENRLSSQKIEEIKERIAGTGTR